MLCALILYMSGETYSLKSTTNDRFFDKLFMAILFTLRVFCQKSAERKSLKKYFFYFVLMSNLGLEPGLYVLYLLDYGDFIVFFIIVLCFYIVKVSNFSIPIPF